MISMQSSIFAVQKSQKLLLKRVLTATRNVKVTVTSVLSSVRVARKTVGSAVCTLNRAAGWIMIAVEMTSVFAVKVSPLKDWFGNSRTSVVNTKRQMQGE